MIDIQIINNIIPKQDSIKLKHNTIVNEPEEIIIQKTMVDVDNQIRKVM